MLPRIFTDVANGGGSVEPVDAAILTAARAGEPDRYLAALLAPAAVRADLLALAAFAAELARIPYAARREPAMAEVRLRWWRDALELPPRSASGHPIADQLRRALARHGLDGARLIGLIDARACDLEPLPFADDAALEAHLVLTEGALFGLAAQLLGPATLPPTTWSAASAGQAYGLARLLVGLPAALARGQVPIPQARLAAAGLAARDLTSAWRPELMRELVGELGQQARAHLAAARLEVTKLPRDRSIAVLPLALVESYVRASVRAVRQGTQRTTVAPLTRIAKIAGARMFGRL